MAEGSVKKIILVAGVEYPRYKKSAQAVRGKRGLWWVLASGRKTPIRGPKGSHWRVRCMSLAEQKLRVDPTIEVYLYDFDRAIQERVRLVSGRIQTEPMRRTFPPLVDADYRWVDNGMLRPIESKPLSRATYPDRPYIRYCPMVSKLSTGPVSHADWIAKFEKTPWSKVGLSIRHVYEHVEFIGKNHPYALHELHLFGHASSSHRPRSGTALVNTNHYGSATKRHPLDLDARADLDFTSAHINQSNFRKAFAAEAQSQVWGCNWHRPVFDMARQASAKAGTKKLLDTTQITFRWRGEGVSGPKDEFKEILEAGTGGWVDKKNTIVRDGAFVRRKLTELMNTTYMQQLANASSRCVSGGLPGTYSEYDARREGREPILTHIPMGRYGTTDVFNRVLRLYAVSLGATFNKKGVHPKYGRGFGVYCAQP